jgi:hypothetical protein
VAKQDKLDRVPPYLPLLWQDWRSSADVRGMTPAQRGIYLDILIEQWISGDVPRDAWRLSQAIRADYKLTVRFLTKYCHLLVCCQCGASWTPVNCQCGASKSSAKCHNLKLKNLRNDVDSDIALGTTKPNVTEREPNPTETEPLATVPSPSEPVQIIETGKEAPALKPLAVRFMKLLGSKPEWDKPAVGKRWEQQAAALGDPAHVAAVMDWAFAGWWASKIKTVRKTDPMTYFCEKFETMATQMDGEKQEAAKKQAANNPRSTLKSQDPKYDHYHTTTKV